MGEFGGAPSFQPSPQGATPRYFASASNLFSSPAVAVSPPVPAGVTWVALGADFAGHCTPVIVSQWLYAYLFDAASQAIWSAREDMSGSSSVQGASWRGAIPFLPGQRMQAQASVDGIATYTACAIWGVELPYVMA